MAVVKGFIGAVWSWGVSLPAFVVRSLLARGAGAFIDFIWPRGYKPCNEMLDPFVDACANRPAGEGVRVPWVDSDAGERVVLNNTGRLLSYISIVNGWFGLAVKEVGGGVNAKRQYRYYYRRSLAGNWFAEIWSVPKSGLIAGGLTVPLLYPASNVFQGKASAAPEDGLLLLISGLLLVVCFLPRAILGRGIHFSAIAPINGGLYGGYGCAWLINWLAGLGGLSFLFIAMAAEWNVGAVMNLIASGVAAYWGEIQEGIREGDIFNTIGFVVVGIPVSAALGCLVAIASMAVPVGAVWYVSLRFLAARQAKAQLEALPFNATQEAMYLNSDLQHVAEARMPQIALGYLVYLAGLFGFVLHPITVWVIRLF
ncbi:MAG: hypothetical protein H5U32_03720 [Pseudomonas balearica]|uniref:hypothetical protein n=1 Tax=Stutzerimonas balearica TaxID=74829 RepID=UPI0019B55BAA|nr:hypothetical protein [Stutzerimonas balearica]MBC7198339.1 hypothetical protein [Stutzerimonas balearica]